MSVCDSGVGQIFIVATRNPPDSLPACGVVSILPQASLLAFVSASGVVVVAKRIHVKAPYADAAKRTERRRRLVHRDLPTSDACQSDIFPCSAVTAVETKRPRLGAAAARARTSMATKDAPNSDLTCSEAPNVSAR